MEGGKVIKINLMGAIGTIILIICVIIGIVVFVNKNKSSNSKKDNNNIILEKEKYSEIDITEEVYIKGETKNITMRTVKSPLKYKINYDVDSFYFKREGDTDKFESNVTETSEIIIKKNQQGFEEKVKELIESEQEKKSKDNTYILDSKKINGKTCYIEEFVKDNSLNRYYYIAKDDDYYEIQTKCGLNFAESIVPITEKMMESFETTI